MKKDSSSLPPIQKQNSISFSNSSFISSQYTPNKYLDKSPKSFFDKSPKLSEKDFILTAKNSPFKIDNLGPLSSTRSKNNNSVFFQKQNQDNSMISTNNQSLSMSLTNRKLIQKYQEDKEKMNTSIYTTAENQKIKEKLNFLNSASEKLFKNQNKSFQDELMLNKLDDSNNKKKVQQLESHLNLSENSKTLIEIPPKRIIYAKILTLGQELPLRFSCEGEDDNYQIYFSFTDQYPDKYSSITIPDKRQNHLYKAGDDSKNPNYFFFSFFSEEGTKVHLKVWFNGKTFID